MFLMCRYDNYKKDKPQKHTNYEVISRKPVEPNKCCFLIVGERKIKSSSRLLPGVQAQTRKIITVKAIQSPQGIATLVPINQEITVVPLDQPAAKSEGAAGGTRGNIGQTKFQKLALINQRVADGHITPGPVLEAVDMDCQQIEPLLEMTETAASKSYKVSHFNDKKPLLTASKFIPQNSFILSEGKEITTFCDAQLLGIKGGNVVVNDDHGILGVGVSESDGVISTSASSNGGIQCVQTSQQVTEEQKLIALAANTLTSAGLKFESEQVTGHVMESSAPSSGEKI